MGHARRERVSRMTDGQVAPAARGAVGREGGPGPAQNMMPRYQRSVWGVSPS